VAGERNSANPMYSSRQIEDALASLREEALTRDIIIPLLQEMGYKDVRYVHGTFEHGVDVLGHSGGSFWGRATLTRCKY